VQWTKANMVLPGEELAADADLDIPTSVESVEEALAILQHHHGEWVKRNG